MQTNNYLETNCFFPFEPVVQRIFQLFPKGNLIQKSDFFSTNTHFRVFCTMDLKTHPLTHGFWNWWRNAEDRGSLQLNAGQVERIVFVGKELLKRMVWG